MKIHVHGERLFLHERIGGDGRNRFLATAYPSNARVVIELLDGNSTIPDNVAAQVAADVARLARESSDRWMAIEWLDNVEGHSAIVSPYTAGRYLEEAFRSR